MVASSSSQEWKGVPSWPPLGLRSTGLGKRLQNLPKSNYTFCAGRKAGRNEDTLPGLLPALPALFLGGVVGSLAGSLRLEGNSDFRPRYHSSYLELGDPSAQKQTPSSPLMITATDLLPVGLDLVSLRTEGYKHTQQKMLGHPGQPEGANWLHTPVTLHWCRDQDLCAEMCVVLSQTAMSWALYETLAIRFHYGY